MYGAGLLRQAVAGQNDWRFLYLSSRKERKRRKVCSAVLRGRYHRPCSSGRCRGKAYHEKFRRCDREGKKSWRTKHAYFPWRPSGTPLPQNREGGHLLCRCPPFGTPDQTLTGGLPLRRRSLYTTELRGYMGIRLMVQADRYRIILSGSGLSVNGGNSRSGPGGCRSTIHVGQLK